jgi:hypothetical protein
VSTESHLNVEHENFFYLERSTDLNGSFILIGLVEYPIDSSDDVVIFEKSTSDLYDNDDEFNYSSEYFISFILR